MFSGSDAPWHWAIVILVAIALFGYKKMPDAARALGRSLRIFKTEIKGMVDDDSARESAKTATTSATPPAETKPIPAAEVVPPVNVDKPAQSAQAAQGAGTSAGDESGSA
jgi:sec-independent protein translocase protein TatA